MTSSPPWRTIIQFIRENCTRLVSSVHCVLSYQMCVPKNVRKKIRRASIWHTKKCVCGCVCVWHENTQRNSQWTLAKANGVEKKLRESSLYRSIGISMSHKNKKTKITKIYSAGETLHCTPNGIKTIRKIQKIFKHACIGERRTRENDLFSTFWMLFFARWGPSAGRNSQNIHMWCARVCLCLPFYYRFGLFLWRKFRAIPREERNTAVEYIFYLWMNCWS